MLAQVRLRLAGVNTRAPGQGEERGTGGVIASTIVVLLARGEHFAALWAGDSRIYLMRDGQLMRLTRDHSLVQELVDAGEIDAADAESHPRANVITRAVGADSELLLDKVADRIQPGDRYMLCSDGVFKELPEARIAALLAQGAKAGDLVRLAVEAGGRDNVSVVLIEA
jgi:serine/threonine-protein phosphatase Stp1